LHIVASDISPNVCSIFQENNRRLVKYHIPFILSDLFKKIGNRYNIIVSNPPYLKDKTVDKMKSRGWPEPESALRGGKEGLSIIYRLISQSVDHLKPDGYLLMEAESIQMKKIERKMVECGFKDIQVFKDLSGLSRVIGGRK
jgi:release factor glutamine methyltransferase